MNVDLVVQGGTVVLETGTLPADVLIRGRRVLGLVRHGAVDPGRARVIDASGGLVLPGGVDVHTHVGIAFGDFRTRDDFASATKAGAIGGTTSLLEFAFPEPGESPVRAVARRISEASGSAWVDFGFHAAIVRETDPAALAGVEQADRMGAPSVKCSRRIAV